MATKKHLEVGSLISATVYAFNLDKRELGIEDYDLFVPNKEGTFSEGFRLKVVNPDIIEVTRASIYLVKPPFRSIDDALRKSDLVPSNFAEIVQEKDFFGVKIYKPLTISPKLAALLLLEYKLRLRGNGSRLFYCGSVQPSDYSIIKEYLNIKNVKKKVKMAVFSCRPFEGWTFNASKLIAFPDGGMSILDGVQRFTREFNMKINLEEWEERAYYFGLFIE